MKLYSILLLVLFLALSSCKKSKMHFIQVKDDVNGTTCTIVPYYNSTMRNLKQFPKTLVNQITKSDIIILENDSIFLTSEEIYQRYNQIESLPPDSDMMLKDVISSQTYSKLETLMRNENLDIIVFDRMQPWAIALTSLPYFIYDKIGITNNEILNYVKSDVPNTKIEFLNEFGYDYNYYNNLSYKHQEQLLVSAIEQYNNTETLVNLLSLKDSGNFEELHKMYNLMHKKDKTQEKILLELYIPLTNYLYNLIIDKMNNKSELFIIISPNLIFGENGLVKKIQLNNENISVHYY